MTEQQLEQGLIEKLGDLKYEYRPDIRDRDTLEANFKEKFEALNRVTLTDGEFQRLLDVIVTPDVYEAARSLRNREAFIRDDGTPLNYTLVNIKDWCKNTFEVVTRRIDLPTAPPGGVYEAGAVWWELAVDPAAAWPNWLWLEALD